MSRGLDWDKARRRDAAQATPSGGDEWWWIPGGGRCSSCREYGVPRAYNHILATTLCGICVDAMGLSPKKSKRFIASQSGKAQPKKRKGRRRGR